MRRLRSLPVMGAMAPTGMMRGEVCCWVGCMRAYVCEHCTVACMRVFKVTYVEVFG